VLYEGVRRDGTVFRVDEVFGQDGRVTLLDAPWGARLGHTRWGLSRQTRADAGGAARVIRTLESSPFYARSQVETRLMGQSVAAMHETIDLRRFRSSIVRSLFYLRMRREVSWSGAPRLGLVARLRP
jgi:carotenoid 1,2-hydratase